MGFFTHLSLFVTDLDRTLIGNGAALDRLNQILAAYRHDFGTKIVYATGRSRKSYQDLAATHQLLTPDALIAAAGTEIYIGGATQSEPEWVNKLSINWQREQLVAIASRFADLNPQPSSEQQPFKVSYYLSANVVSAALPELQSLCQAQQLDITAIYSSNRDLDLLPKGGDKGRAVQFLRTHWQIDPTETVVCGDAGDDISLYEYGDERGIIVGNADPELRLWHELHRVSYHYLAVAEYAVGILEGLQYFQFVS